LAAGFTNERVGQFQHHRTNLLTHDSVGVGLDGTTVHRHQTGTAISSVNIGDDIDDAWAALGVAARRRRGNVADRLNSWKLTFVALVTDHNGEVANIDGLLTMQ